MWRFCVGGFQIVNFLLLPFYRLAQFRYLHIIREVVGGKGIHEALRDMLDVLIVLRIRTSGGTKHIDGVHIVGIVLEHNSRLLGIIPFSNMTVILLCVFAETFF